MEEEFEFTCPEGPNFDALMQHFTGSVFTRLWKRDGGRYNRALKLRMAQKAAIAEHDIFGRESHTLLSDT